jgi:hypothetical protein
VVRATTTSTSSSTSELAWAAAANGGELSNLHAQLSNYLLLLQEELVEVVTFFLPPLQLVLSPAKAK